MRFTLATHQPAHLALFCPVCATGSKLARTCVIGPEVHGATATLLREESAGATNEQAANRPRDLQGDNIGPVAVYRRADAIDVVLPGPAWRRNIRATCHRRGFQIQPMAKSLAAVTFLGSFDVPGEQHDLLLRRRLLEAGGGGGDCLVC